MAIKVGDKLPDVTLYKGTAEGPQAVSTADLLGSGKKVVFALPGAYTPTCSAQHLPGFITHLDALKEKGVDEVICLSVNDAFVMAAWGKDNGADGKVTMVGDGDGEFTKAVGLELDLMGRGLGLRSQRYAMIVEEGVVTELAVEEGGAFEVSSAEAVLAKL